MASSKTRRSNTGNSGGSFTPTKANLYAAVKAIFHPNSNVGVSADDTHNELDVLGGDIGLTKYTVDIITVYLRNNTAINRFDEIEPEDAIKFARASQSPATREIEVFFAYRDGNVATLGLASELDFRNYLGSGGTLTNDQDNLIANVTTSRSSVSSVDQNGEYYLQVNQPAAGAAAFYEVNRRIEEEAYTLPDATESVTGGVQGATQAQATGASGTTILGWTNTRLRQFLSAALPTISNADATDGSSTARRVWSATLVRAAINAVVPAVFRAGNTSLIPTNKLGSGTADATKVLKGDQSWGDAEAGTEVAANPSADSTATLTKVEIDGVVYVIPTGDAGGLTSVAHDDTLTGNGTGSDDLLSVAFPFTQELTDALNALPRPYDAAFSYRQSQQCSFEQNVYASLINDNRNHSPATSPNQWRLLTNWNQSDTDARINAALVRVIQSASATEIPDWAAANTYGIFRFVKHTDDALYLSIAQNNNRGKEPGQASDWRSYWYRVGYADGAPGSLTDITVDGSTLTVDKRDGTTKEVQLPSGGTEVSANPSGTDGEVINRIRISNIDYKIPQAASIVFYERPTFAFADVAASQDISSSDFSQTILDAVSIDGPIYSEWDFISEWVGALEFDCDRNGTIAFTMTTTHVFNGKTIVSRKSVQVVVSRTLPNVLMLNAFNSFSRIQAGSFTDSDGNTVTITDEDLQSAVVMSFALSATYSATRGSTGSESISNLVWNSPGGRFYQQVHESGAVPQPPRRQPHISSFVSTSGDLDPQPGSIANLSYAYTYAIANSDEVSSARIIGFLNDFDADNVTVLDTIESGSYAQGNGSVSIPHGITLNADDSYHLRLQVFGSDHSAAASYQDIVITAHAPATANYHWGLLPYVENKTPTQYAADIVFGSSGTDLVTDQTLDTQNGYDAVPKSSGGWVFYLAAKSSELQPTGWTTGGLPASAVFNSAVDQTIGTETFKVYVMRNLYYRDIHDGTENYKPTR